MREALNLAINRNAIRGSIFSKDVIPATQLVVPSINGHNSRLKVWPYNPARARKLLAEARRDGVPVNQEILMLGRIGIYPNATEVMEAMLSAAGFNVRVKMVEVAEWVDILTKPYAEDRVPTVLQSQHDNNSGDAVFTIYNKYHCDGAQSAMCDPGVDRAIDEASVAAGTKRRERFQDAFQLINDKVIADVPMFHMVGYTRVGQRIRFQPSISTNSELQISQIRFR